MSLRSRATFIDRSGKSYPLTDPRWRGDDGSPLSLSELPGLTPAQIVPLERSIWRYQGVLPVDPASGVSLGEGWT
ncbi:MAG: hypothetical protein KC438_14780, partial [Thermomicrobiales bacterium]|nr:hypothetical protein [Thermomicrobiales bacterium]